MDTINLEASPRLRWRSDWFFLVLALLGGVALATAEFVDPTVFSPLTPPEGIHNWLGLPGALIDCGVAAGDIWATNSFTVLVSDPSE